MLEVSKNYSQSVDRKVFHGEQALHCTQAETLLLYINFGILFWLVAVELFVFFPTHILSQKISDSDQFI